jgi:hypothetical protein
MAPGDSFATSGPFRQGFEGGAMGLVKYRHTGR